MTSELEVKKREQVDKLSTWKVEDIYPSMEAWQSDFDAVKKSEPPYFPELKAFQGRLGSSPTVLKEALETLLDLVRKLDKLFIYAQLRHDEEIGRGQTKEIYEKILWLSSELDKERSFFEPELLALGAKKLESLASDPLLGEYRFYLEKIIRMSPHTLSQDKELLLAMAKKPLSASAKVFTAINNADLKFADVEDGEGRRRPLTHGLYSLYMRSHDRVLRKNAFEGMLGRYGEFENSFAEMISGEIEGEIFLAKARDFSSSLASALYPWAIPETVYHTLIKTVRRHRSVIDRYIKLKKKLLGLDEIHFYDLYAPPEGVQDRSFTKEEAVNLVIEAVEPLGKAYQDKLWQGLSSSRWVDWEESEGKRSGAYSSGGYDTPPYILMNYRGTMRDLFTLAHEAGHSMHSLLSQEKQPFHYYRYPIFTAEIASTLNEELLMACLLKKITQPRERVLLIHERIEDIRATFFRQTLFAEFELALSSRLERGDPLTASAIKEIYFSINRDYYGSELILDPSLNLEWARIPHFYYHFYVYQYATGLAAAMALAQSVMQNKSAAYLDFLSSGGSAFPLDLLKKAGVDLTTEAPIVALIDRFNYWMDQLESAWDLTT